MANIIFSVFGMVFLFIIPGYTASLILLRRTTALERITLSFGLSMAMALAVSFLLSATRLFTTAGGLTTVNFVVMMAATTLVLAGLNRYLKSESY